MLARERERVLVVPANLLGRNALLQPVVAREQQVVDLLAGFVRVHRPDTVRADGVRPGQRRKDQIVGDLVRAILDAAAA